MSFSKNIKVIIKKKGYKLGTFPKIYLNMSSQTFGHQLKNDNLKSSTIEKILNVLNVTFEDVIKMNVKIDTKTTQNIARSPGIEDFDQISEEQIVPKILKSANPVNTITQNAPKNEGSKKRNLLKGLY